MADVAKRLCGPTQMGTSAATVYTVPASTTAILRNIHVANNSGSMVTFSLSIGSNAAATQIFTTTPVGASGGVLDWSGFMVLTAGEIIQALASAGASMTLTISGVESA
jgi:hypothetical protein